jgi:hypothetical protein
MSIETLLMRTRNNQAMKLSENIASIKATGGRPNLNRILSKQQADARTLIVYTPRPMAHAMHCQPRARLLSTMHMVSEPLPVSHQSLTMSGTICQYSLKSATVCATC